MNNSFYIKFINELRQEILSSRLHAAKLVNKELLLLYYKVGKRISIKINEERWGAKVIANISLDLQKKLPGLRGFSSTNLKYMKQFYEMYSFLDHNTTTLVAPLKNMKKKPIGQSVTDQFVTSVYGLSAEIFLKKYNVSLTDFLSVFFRVSFTHHCKIISSTQKFDELLFYINNTAEQAWSVATLDYHLESKSFKKQGKLASNFKNSLPKNIRDNAIQAFRDEYLLDFINIQNPNEIDERVIEQSIVTNIKNFLLSLGREYTFMGNQYRILVDDEEFFIDLLFFHRGLRCLIAFDLKSGKFKPEYTGKMSFYLNALNDQIKLPNENPSIGIILCKEKKNTIVEYSFADTKKPIGVATYTFTKKIPSKLKKYLPPTDKLINIVSEATIEYESLNIQNNE